MIKYFKKSSSDIFLAILFLTCCWVHRENVEWTVTWVWLLFHLHRKKKCGEGFLPAID